VSLHVVETSLQLVRKRVIYLTLKCMHKVLFRHQRCPRESCLVKKEKNR